RRLYRFSDTTYPGVLGVDPATVGFLSPAAHHWGCRRNHACRVRGRHRGSGGSRVSLSPGRGRVSSGMITLCSVADTMIVGLFSHACVPGRAVSLTPPTGRPTRGSFREASIPGPGAVF